MNKTSIEWVKNPDGTQGYTWNPLTGCINHVNGICNGGSFPCYAYQLANTRLRDRYLANKNVTPIYQSMVDAKGHLKNALKDPFYPRFWPERLSEITNKLRRWGKNKIVHTHKPRGVFVCDMSDLFGIGIPEEWTRQVLEKMQYAKQDRFYLLTKRPENLAKFSPFPDNCWVGVTVCNDEMLDVAVDKLEDIQAKHKFISFEPLLKRLTLSLDYALYYSGISWVIIGAQTKPTVYPKIEWVEEIVRACDKAGVAVFLKNNLKPLLRNEEGWTPAWAVTARGCDGTEYLLQELPQ